MNEDLSQLVGKIMSSPGFGELVNELKQSGVGSANGQPDDKVSGSPPTTEELSAKLPSILSALGSTGTPSKSIDSGTIDKAMNALRKMDSGNCEKLLCALKPYLNRERGDVIDKAVSVMKITDLLGAMGDIPGITK